MAKHHEEHPDYEDLGIFAGYGEYDSPRYRAEVSGAVLDTWIGCRKWFDSFREAIEFAKMKNS